MEVIRIIRLDGALVNAGIELGDKFKVEFTEYGFAIPPKNGIGGNLSFFRREEGEYWEYSVIKCCTL